MIDMAQNSLTVIEQRKPLDANICGAKTRAGSPCQQVAGWGTNHVGSGRCKLHGGASSGRPIVHGRYSVKHHQALSEKIEQFLDSPIDDLTNELALVRAVLQDFLDKMVNSPNEQEQAALLSLVGEIRQTVSAINKIKTNTALTGQEIQLFVVTVSSILQKYVPGENLPDAINELRAAFRPRRSH